MKDLGRSFFASVKMVVWDLDGTIWHGVLAEGLVTPRLHLVDLIRQLAEAGIVQSVCSHNEFDLARAELERLGLWDLFVLPRIEYTKKSVLVAEILTVSQLRPLNVLVVDNEPRLLAEIEAHCGVQIMLPECLGRVGAYDLAPSKSASLRIAHYRNLERRWLARGSFGDVDSDDDFLRKSDIRVSLVTVTGLEERVVELITRAHQLNYTRTELPLKQIGTFAADQSVYMMAVRVEDRFGDYGVSGFFVFDRTRHRFTHFVFSCRLLGMGVDAFLWDLLGEPELSELPGGPPLTQLGRRVDWIRLVEESQTSELPSHTNRPKVFLKGGCEIEPIASYCGSGPLDCTVESFSVRNGVQLYGHSSLDVLRLVASNRTGLVSSVPWLAQSSDTKIFDVESNVVVLSLWVDFAATRYRHRIHGFPIPVFEPLDTSPAQANWDHWWGPSRVGRHDFLTDFSSDCATTKPELVDSLCWLRSKIDSNIRLLVINAPEVKTSWVHSSGQAQHERNVDLNMAVFEACEQSDVEVIDVRRWVRRIDDLDDDRFPFHYKRWVYSAMAAAIEEYAAKFSTKRGFSDGSS
jgi:FkbH-like protein